VLGVVLVVLALVLVGPVAVMLAGAAWSGVVGWLLGDDADTRAEGQPT
jgi:hypothetical protein